MAQNQVTKLWTAIVIAFLALCTTLGLITTTAAAAVPQTGTTSNSSAHTMTPATAHEPWSFTRSLPPTMKQRIRAEAHGKSPSCRHRSPADADTDTATDTDAMSTEATSDSPEDTAPLQL
ncbi:DUF6344 domain-containing protein [Streptomyces pseudovenezuelae]|uniref:Uncharacterized protein n=1 Tax=Streptomyces pseudovenezuelae TaxID=67350 RepID=A0ABT6LFG9_9ACTN|nr:DUF6344 domain-containing protein [Streptomyces pseudovenezuelae]MDH6215037.1 hypothetical protein [Streptomyces pseudovenezuelae]